MFNKTLVGWYTKVIEEKIEFDSYLEPNISFIGKIGLELSLGRWCGNKNISATDKVLIKGFVALKVFIRALQKSW